MYRGARRNKSPSISLCKEGNRIYEKNMKRFRERVLEIVSQIPEGTVLTYQEVAKKAGNMKAMRAVGTIMKENQDPKIPCFRVVRSDMGAGEYNRGERKKKKLLRAEGSLDVYGHVVRYESRGKYISRAHTVEVLKNGGIGVIPTDTIYGIVCRAEDHRSVWQVYRVRERNIAKPCIVLIADAKDVERFGVRLSTSQKKILKVLWPAPISVVLPCEGREFSYLTRGTDSIAFRVPDDEDLRTLLEETGPLIAPSANREGDATCETAKEAKRVFGESVDVYVHGSRLRGKASTLISLEGEGIVIKREGVVTKRNIIARLRGIID